MIKISGFSTVQTELGVIASSNVEIDGARQQIEFSIQAPINRRSEIGSDPSAFVIGMLIPAMERGEDIFVDGELDSTLLHKLNFYVVPFLLAYNPALKSISVDCAATKDTPVSGKVKGALTGMSCGVDSLETFNRYSHEDTPGRYRVRSLAIYDVGAFGKPGSSDATLRKEKTVSRAKTIAERSGCDLFLVQSNLLNYYKTPFSKCVTVLNATCAFSLADICDVYLGASSTGYNMISMQDTGHQGLDAYDSILCSLFNGPRLEIFSSGAGTDRFRKILDILENSKFIEKIDVCTRPSFKKNSDKNCGTCHKCGQFLMIAERQGIKDRFADGFDLAEYERRKWRVCQRMVAMAKVDSKKSTAKEIQTYLEEGSFEFPFGSRIAGTVLGSLHRVIPVFGVKYIN